MKPELSALHRGYIGGKPTGEQPPKKLKPKACSKAKGGCGETFQPARLMQKACGIQCAANMVACSNKRKAERQAKSERAKTRALKEAMKTVPHLKREAQRAFNAWIRQRDAGQPCISCGTPSPDLSALHAGRDAGHYRSTGSADHLRFHEDNCHAQCVKCNQYKAGNAVDYRIGLIARIGLLRVEDLEADNRPIKWTREGLRAIRDDYRKKLKGGAPAGTIAYLTALGVEIGRPEEEKEAA